MTNLNFNQVTEERAITIAELTLPLLPPEELIELISVYNKIIGNRILEQMGRLKTKDQ